VQVVLGRLRLDVSALAREQSARRVDALASRVERAGDRALREPVDLEVRAQPAQLIGDGKVASDMTEPDRRGEEERAPPARPAPRPQ